MRLPRARFGSVQPLDRQAQVLLIAIAETEVFNVIAGDADQKDAVGAIADRQTTGGFELSDKVREATETLQAKSQERFFFVTHLRQGREHTG